MPWHRVVHSCTHVDSHDLTGSRRDRDRMAEWRSKGPCRRCYKRGLADAAAAWCAAQGLPPLVGRAAERRAGEQARAAALRPHLVVPDVSVIGRPANLYTLPTAADLMRHATPRLRALAGEVRAWRVEQAATHVDPAFWASSDPAFERHLRDGWAQENPARREWLVAEIAAAHARWTAARAAEEAAAPRPLRFGPLGAQASATDDPDVRRLAAGLAEAEVRAAESRVVEAALQARAEARRAAAARRRGAGKNAARFTAAVAEPEIPRISARAEHERVPRSA